MQDPSETPSGRGVIQQAAASSLSSISETCFSFACARSPGRTSAPSASSLGFSPLPFYEADARAADVRCAAYNHAWHQTRTTFKRAFERVHEPVLAKVDQWLDLACGTDGTTSHVAASQAAWFEPRKLLPVLLLQGVEVDPSLPGLLTSRIVSGPGAPRRRVAVSIEDVEGASSLLAAISLLVARVYAALQTLKDVGDVSKPPTPLQLGSLDHLESLLKRSGCEVLVVHLRNVAAFDSGVLSDLLCALHSLANDSLDDEGADRPHPRTSRPRVCVILQAQHAQLALEALPHKTLLLLDAHDIALPPPRLFWDACVTALYAPQFFSGAHDGVAASVVLGGRTLRFMREHFMESNPTTVALLDCVQLCLLHHYTTRSLAALASPTLLSDRAPSPPRPTCDMWRAAGVTRLRLAIFGMRPTTEEQIEADDEGEESDEADRGHLEEAVRRAAHTLTEASDWLPSRPGHDEGSDAATYWLRQILGGPSIPTGQEELGGQAHEDEAVLAAMPALRAGWEMSLVLRVLGCRCLALLERHSRAADVDATTSTATTSLGSTPGYTASGQARDEAEAVASVDRGGSLTSREVDLLTASLSHPDEDVGRTQPLSSSTRPPTVVVREVRALAARLRDMPLHRLRAALDDVRRVLFSPRSESLAWPGAQREGIVGKMTAWWETYARVLCEEVDALERLLPVHVDVAGGESASSQRPTAGPSRANGGEPGGGGAEAMEGDGRVDEDEAEREARRLADVDRRLRLEETAKAAKASVASWWTKKLRTWLEPRLSDEPLASAWSYDSVRRLEALIDPDPRASLLLALARPEAYLGHSPDGNARGRESVSGKTTTAKVCDEADDVPDVCRAFSLYTNAGRFVNLADWLDAFAASLPRRRGRKADGDVGSADPRTRTGAAVESPSRGRKRKRTAAAAARRSEESGGVGAEQADGDASPDDKDDDDTVNGEDDHAGAAPLDQVRFAAALHQLVAMGLVRRTRRRPEHVLRTVFDLAPAPLPRS